MSYVRDLYTIEAFKNLSSRVVLNIKRRTLGEEQYMSKERMDA